MWWAGGALPEIRKTQTYSPVVPLRSMSPQRRSCRVFSGGWPSARWTRWVRSPSKPAHSSTSLKCVSGSPARITPPAAVLQALLVLDADRIAPERVRDAQRGDVRAALPQQLVLGQLGGLVPAELEGHALPPEPPVNGAGLPPAHPRGGVVERGLGEPLLVYASGEQELVRDDGVVHAHAALVEDAEDRLAGPEVAGQPARHDGRPPGHPAPGERPHVRRGVADPSRREPAPEPVDEELVGEVLAPERR